MLAGRTGAGLRSLPIQEETQGAQLQRLAMYLPEPGAACARAPAEAPAEALPALGAASEVRAEAAGPLPEASPGGVPSELAQPSRGVGWAGAVRQIR
ncbi:unnamed protein product [Prorocentrum cordatum]|uniref:Uncharacterized protein n=1 Tax=Prorocentrum cordatum TaxID=2364126 RepID=A0ABN9SQS1_9DINO|nr:unnamed protein product [Polarella glacialis]